MVTDLAKMKAGKSGIVTLIDGGLEASKRLEALGIRPGIRISKISAQLFRGPVVVNVNHRRVALGYGLAGKVFVSTEEEAK